jgi:uncharacterized protein YuzE
MKFNYDRVADAVYIKLNNAKVKKTVEMGTGIVVDLGEKGKLVGIEILNFSFQQDKKNQIAKLIERGIPLNITESTPSLA